MSKVNEDVFLWICWHQTLSKQLNDIYKFVGNFMSYDSLIMCHYTC